MIRDISIRTYNILYRLWRWEKPDGKTLVGQLPTVLEGRHFGSTLVSCIRDQRHRCEVTQPLLREQLGEWGFEISAVA